MCVCVCVCVCDGGSLNAEGPKAAKAPKIENVKEGPVGPVGSPVASEDEMQDVPETWDPEADILDDAAGDSQAPSQTV